MKKTLVLFVVFSLIVLFTGTLKAESDIFSVNFYGYGKGGSTLWDQPSWRETVTLESGQSAGVGQWHTSGWVNYNGNRLTNITSTQSSVATIKVDNDRNYSPYYWGAKRGTLLGDGNADMMDGHGRGSLLNGDGAEIFDFTVSNIPFEYYDVIVYLGCCASHSGNDEATIVFNGVSQDFVVMDELFDGTFTEFVDGDTPCNYIVYEGVSGGSFSIQIWGNGLQNSNHIGPRGVQIMESTVAPPEKVTSPAPSDEAMYVYPEMKLNWTAGLFSSSSDVYFGTSPSLGSGDFKGNQSGTTFDPGTLAAGTYYWRVDSVNSAGTTTGDVWSFTVSKPDIANTPRPIDDSTGVSRDLELKWIDATGASSYNIYFGTDPTPDSSEFMLNKINNKYTPPAMEPGTTYYWRVDAVNSLGVTTGDVWSFTTMPTPASGKNTFLVPMPYVGASWKELAYLAAVPASAAVNDNTPSVIALDESGTIPAKVSEYLTYYNPANIYTIDTSGSLEDVVCYLARTFWEVSDKVVLCDKNDYRNALAASALAGRLEVPLMFFDGSNGLSAAVQGVIENDLKCSSAITVNGNSTVTGQLGGIGISETTIADDKAIIAWLVDNGYPVEYLSVCNSYDRNMTDYAPKGSLAAAALAAGRNGAVASLDYESEWNTPFFHNKKQLEKPAGLRANAEPPQKLFNPDDLNYYLGTFTLNGATHDFAIARINDNRDVEALFIDFNDDGDYGDPGEHCPRNSEVVVNGKRYLMGVTTGAIYYYGEVRFSHPTDDELKDELQTYHDQIGHHPEYMALVGMPQVVACAHAPNTGSRNWMDYVMSDNYFADVDDDPLYEIATGRIVGENVTYVTLSATRGLTYSDMIYRPAANHVFHQCTEEFAGGLYDHPRNLENNGFIIDEWLFMDDEDYGLYGIFIQHEHGWPYGIARQEFLDNSPWTTCLVEGTGCHLAALDKNVPGKKWYDSNAVVLAREGAVCFNGWVRGTGAGKTICRDAFYSAILNDGATMGQAHLYAWNVYAAKETDQLSGYNLVGNMMYGDPAVKLHLPAEPAHKAAHVTTEGSTMTVHAPETYWVDTNEMLDYYVYGAPGLIGTISESVDGTFFATYKTGLEITDMTQEGSVPYPLGWQTLRENKKFVVDEHWDGTRTIYLRVRFEQFNDSTGQFTKKIDQIDYEVDFVTSQIAGDLDMNDRVDMVDFSRFARNWLETDCDMGNSFCEGADINMVDDVTIDDLMLLVGNWLTSVQAQ